MLEARVRAEMEALMASLIQREQALLSTRLRISVAPKVAPLVDTRSVGKAPTFAGEHNDWPEWSFQFTAYMESANPKHKRESHQGCSSENTRLRGSQPSCRGSALMTVNSTKVNNVLEAWRGLKAICDSNSMGRQ